MTGKRDHDRMTFETTEVTKRAIRLRAAVEGVKPADVVNAALEAHLGREIALARERLASGHDGGHKQARKRNGEHL